MVVKTYKEITRYHVIRHGIYDVFFIPDPNKNPKDTYDLFRNSGRFNLQKIIDHVDTFKSTADQCELY